MDNLFDGVFNHEPADNEPIVTVGKGTEPDCAVKLNVSQRSYGGAYLKTTDICANGAGEVLSVTDTGKLDHGELLKGDFKFGKLDLTPRDFSHTSDMDSKIFTELLQSNPLLREVAANEKLRYTDIPNDTTTEAQNVGDARTMSAILGHRG